MTKEKFLRLEKYRYFFLLMETVLVLALIVNILVANKIDSKCLASYETIQKRNAEILLKFQSLSPGKIRVNDDVDVINRINSFIESQSRINDSCTKLIEQLRPDGFSNIFGLSGVLLLIWGYHLFR